MSYPSILLSVLGHEFAAWIASSAARGDPVGLWFQDLAKRALGRV